LANSLILAYNICCSNPLWKQKFSQKFIEPKHTTIPKKIKVQTGQCKIIPLQYFITPFNVKHQRFIPKYEVPLKVKIVLIDDGIDGW